MVSLCTSRCKILVKTRKRTRDATQAATERSTSASSLKASSFKLNKKFSSNFFRVRVPLLKKVSVSGQGCVTVNPLISFLCAESTHLRYFERCICSDSNSSKGTIQQIRIHHIDSVIVRVLKARKRITHQQLVIEVTKHLSVRELSIHTRYACPRFFRLMFVNLLFCCRLRVQSRFIAQPGAIKKRIESLMEREYLQRDPDDRSVYEYLA